MGTTVAFALLVCRVSSVWEPVRIYILWLALPWYVDKLGLVTRDVRWLVFVVWRVPWYQTNQSGLPCVRCRTAK